MRRVDLIGLKVGRLTVIGQGPHKRGRIYWSCKCDCGKETVVASYNLRSANPVQSCGCLLVDVGRSLGRSMRKHGETSPSRTPEYRAWENIQARCYNPNHPNYRYYGALGITVCERWRQSFDAFLEDMGRRPSSKHSIDRYPDPAGNYEPSNCRWATALEQRHNWRKEKSIA